VIHNFDTVLFVNVIFPYFLSSSSSFSSGFSANFNKLKALALELGVYGQRCAQSLAASATYRQIRNFSADF